MTIQSKVLSAPPAYAEDKNVRDFLRMANYTMKSDAVNFNDTNSSVVFVAPAQDGLFGTLVLAVTCQIVTVFNGVIPTLSLGVAGTVERHIAAVDIDVTTVGFYNAPLSAPFEYTATTNLIVTIVPGGGSTGVARFWLTYRPYTGLQYERP